MPKTTLELVGKNPDTGAGKRTVQQVGFDKGSRSGHKATTPDEGPSWAVKAGGK